MEDGNNTTTGGDSDAATVMDHLASVRSKLSLTTTEPTKRDLSKIGNLVSRVVKAHDGDRAASLASRRIEMSIPKLLLAFSVPAMDWNTRSTGTPPSIMRSELVTCVSTHDCVGMS